MTPEHKIAYHHLGDMLLCVDHQGKQWQVVCSDGARSNNPTVGFGLTVDAAARNAATRLRAAGWVPTHPRLEWRVDGRESELHFCIDGYAPALFSLIAWDAGEYSMYVYHTPDEDVDMCGPLADAIATISEWCAANLPSYHLPPFPETPDAKND